MSSDVDVRITLAAIFKLSVVWMLEKKLHSNNYWSIQFDVIVRINEVI